MTGRGILLAAGAAALLLAWLFFPRDAGDGPAPIERRARHDLIEACNRSAAITGRAERFASGDVAPSRLVAADAQGGVVALVSVLEARRGGLLCRWNGIDPATISPVE